jgi:FkbM family methyltransferase
MKNHHEINITTKRGYSLNCIEGDTITKAIQANGEYDTNTLDSLADILGKIRPNISLDVGANIGNHAVLIAKYSEKLIAFEPVKFVYDLLQSNLSQNCPANTLAVNKGLSNEHAIREIFVPDYNLGCSSLEAQVGVGEMFNIELIVGDDWISKNCVGKSIDFIKMDIEGHEAAALIGMSDTIVANQPLLLLEWKNKNAIDLFKELDLYNKIFLGYQFFSLSNTCYKKAHRPGIFGRLKRIYYRFFNKKWCLASFKSDQNYSNVYFVPNRYLSLFKEFIYIDSNR